MPQKKYLTLLEAFYQIKSFGIELTVTERNTLLDFAEHYVFVDSTFPSLSKNLKIDIIEVRKMYGLKGMRELLDAMKIIRRRILKTFDTDTQNPIEKYKQFLIWIELQSPACNYCGITEQQIKILIEKGEIQTSRIETRGRSMEIDRKKPSGSYLEENIVLCCYWCNNAKTDTFSYEDFKIYVGPAIKEIWKKKLALSL